MFPGGTFIPRPEYPRPDFQRGRVEGVDWLNLNGPWEFRFDPNREGVDSAWTEPDELEWDEQIIVPFCWESLAAWGEGDGAGNTHYYSSRVFVHPLEVTPENHRVAPRFEVGWYRRYVDLPATPAWRDRRIILHIGAADFFTDCWCNGVHLGRHEGGYVPFEFDLTDTLAESDPATPRRVCIVIRVEDPMDNREQPVGKQWGWYTPTSGIWQTVFVEPRSAAYIESFRFSPDIDREQVQLEVFCAGMKGKTRIDVEILPPEAPARTLTLTGTAARATGWAELRPVSLWDTHSPHLYRIILRLTNPDGQVVDEVRSYFGMRKISTALASDKNASGILRLNNRFIYLRGALYQSYHPDGVYTARHAATLRRDIAYAQEAGFNFLRIHIKLDDPLVLYYADQLGVLLMQDLPNFGEGGDTPLGRRRFEEMLRLGIKRDYNHPSIISWCIFNETWGFGGQTELIKWISPPAGTQGAAQTVEKIANESAFEWIHEMWRLAKTLDSTRLIEDMSVVRWDHLAAYGHVDTDINSWHFYIHDYEKAKTHIEEVVAQTYPGSQFNYITGFTQASAPLINSEYGGVGALDGDRDVSWSFKFLTNELRRHPQLCAYIYTELTDVEWERNGFLRYDRSPKQFGYAPTLVNQPDVLPINAAPIRRVAPGETVEVEVLSSHFSSKHCEDVTFAWRYSGIDTLGTWHTPLERGEAKIPFPQYRVELARRVTVTAPEQPMLCTLAVSALTPDGQIVAANFVQHFVSKEPPPRREERHHSLILRRRVQDWNGAEWTGGTGSRAEAVKAGSCHGRGAGYFEWIFADQGLRELRRARRVRVLMEMSACREGVAQTNSNRYPSRFELLVNGLPVRSGVLRNHPHDARGALSYLRDGRGAYGYLVTANIENTLLQRIAAEAANDGYLRVRCAILPPHSNGLTVYDYDCGRSPVGPTVAVDWEVR